MGWKKINLKGTNTGVEIIDKINELPISPDFQIEKEHIKGLDELLKGYAKTGSISSHTVVSDTAYNLLGGVAGSLPYQTAVNTTGMLAIGTNGYALVSNGTLPVWTNLSLTYLTIASASATYLPLAGGTVTGTVAFVPSSDISAITLKEFQTDPTQPIMTVANSAGTVKWTFNKTKLNSASAVGINLIFDTASTVSSNTTRAGLVVTMNSGYTGSESTTALAFDLNVAGTSSYYLADATVYGYRPAGNRGFGGFARATTTGHNIGGLMLAGGGAVNYAAFCSSTITKAGGFNIGVLGNAHNVSGVAGSAFIGVYATCYNANALPPNMSGIQTALLADNQSYTVPIAIFRSNGVSFVSIEDAGQLLLGNRLSTTSLGRLFNVPADVATTDATLTVAESYTTASDTMYTIQSLLTIQSSDRTKGGTIKMEGTFKNVAGTVTQIGITTLINNTVTDAGITAAFTISGTAVRVSVTGLAATNIRFQNCFIINRVKY